MVCVWCELGQGAGVTTIQTTMGATTIQTQDVRPSLCSGRCQLHYTAILWAQCGSVPSYVAIIEIVEDVLAQHSNNFVVARVCGLLVVCCLDTSSGSSG